MPRTEPPKRKEPGKGVPSRRRFLQDIWELTGWEETQKGVRRRGI